MERMDLDTFPIHDEDQYTDAERDAGATNQLPMDEVRAIAEDVMARRQAAQTEPRQDA